jgi:hypothetical protein
MLFDRTESKYIEEKVRDLVPKTKIGEVVAVTEHTAEDDGSNHEVDVSFLDEDNKRPRTIPVQTSRNGSVDLPNPGDFVLVDFLDSREDYPVMRGTIHTFGERAPLAKAGMSRYRYGDLYIEAYGPINEFDEEDGQWVRLAKKSNDDDSGDAAMAAIEIDDTSPGGALTRVKGNSSEFFIDDTGANGPITKMEGENSSVEIDDTGTNGPITKMEGVNGVVELDDTGSTTEISIQTDGDVNINANGNIVLAGGGNAVAREGDSVEVSDPKSGTLTGTITGGSNNVESG